MAAVARTLLLSLWSSTRWSSRVGLVFVPLQVTSVLNFIVVFFCSVFCKFDQMGFLHLHSFSSVWLYKSCKILLQSYLCSFLSIWFSLNLYRIWPNYINYWAFWYLYDYCAEQLSPKKQQRINCSNSRLWELERLDWYAFPRFYFICLNLMRRFECIEAWVFDSWYIAV